MTIPDGSDPAALSGFLTGLIKQMSLDRTIMSQNITALSIPSTPKKATDDPGPGHGLATNTLTNIMSNLLCPTVKVGVAMANHATNTKVNVSLTYLGVGEFLVGNGGTTTFTADSTVNGANGLDTGSAAANTWYALHVIAGEGSGPGFDPTANNLQFPCVRRSIRQACLLSLSATAPSLPPGYRRFRRVGWVRLNAGKTVYRFTNAANDDLFWWNEDVSAGDFLVLNTAAAAVVFTDIALAKVVPPTAREAVLVAYVSAADLDGTQYKNKDHGNVVFAAKLNQVSIQNEAVADLATGQFSLGCDSSQNIQYRNQGANNATLQVVAYRDLR